MVGLGWSRLSPRRRQQGAQARIAPVRHDPQPQTGQSAVEAGQARHVADGAHGGQVQPLTDIGLSLALEQAAPARLAVQGGQQDEDHPRGRQIALPRAAARPVRIDHGQAGRRLLAHHMVVDDHDLQADGRRMGHGFVSRRPAIDGDDQIGAARLQRVERPGAGAVTLGQAIRHIDRQVGAQRPEPAYQQGRAGRPVHIVVGEDVDAGAALQGVDDGGGGGVHVHEAGRIGEQRLQRRLEEVGALIRRHAARRQGASHHLVQPQRLHMGAGRRRLRRTLPPRPPRQRAADPQKGGQAVTVRHQKVRPTKIATMKTERAMRTFAADSSVGLRPKRSGSRDSRPDAICAPHAPYIATAPDTVVRLRSADGR